MVDSSALGMGRYAYTAIDPGEFSTYQCPSGAAVWKKSGGYLLKPIPRVRLAYRFAVMLISLD
ncbi:hypothetical protein DPPLL_22290 [Desulfofustis limnaeus]|uniref:Uncharacterized protein n=1 Tax=Desulfofustis limnaeus TaxID=2740163 RepID=A0ABM7WA78_9BACT|nr:hypothetical protein DPPLL_22290 [Desulfofustis limnaeus]